MNQKRLISIFLIFLAVASVAVADSDSRKERSLINSSAGADWPLWSGPAGNLTSLGHGLPKGGDIDLEPAWSRPLGSAYSGILVVGGRLVTTFSDGRSDLLVALDASSGQEQWRYRISAAHAGINAADDGPLSTPAIEGGVIYGLGASGELFAVSLADGQERWRHDLLADFGAVKPGFGFATAPTVVGDVVVVATGGENGRAISAFDRATGDLRWSHGDESVQYQSPLAFELGGEVSVVALTDRSLLGLSPETGEVLFRHPHTEGGGQGFTATQPVPVGEGGILLTGARESVLFEVSKSAEGYEVQEAWRSRALRSGYATPAPFEGFLYGYSGAFLTCVDAATGESVWKSRPPGDGFLVLVDGYLMILNRAGEIVVVEATPEAFREVSRVKALERGYFTRPSFAGGRVYARNLKDIVAFGVKDRVTVSSAGSEPTSADWDLRGEFGAFVSQLAVAEKKAEMIERFMADHPSLPIFEGNLVHFVYRGEVEDLAISGNFIRDGSQHPMHRVKGTDFYFRSYELPESSVFTYRYAVFDEPRLDPGNPRTVGQDRRERSLLATPGWRAPSHLREPTGPRGHLEELQWKSEALGNEREVQVYLPPGYGQGEDRYPLLIVNRGDQALEFGELDKSLDNLIGEKVAPMIVAFVPVGNPRELGGVLTADYTRAQVDELIPLLDRTYRTDPRRESRAVLGQDRYGSASFAAIFLALLHPEAVSRAAAQSYEHGQFEEELLAAASGEKHDLKLIFHWSSYDRQVPFWDWDARREAQAVVAALEKNGYRPKVLESTDGPGWGLWQSRLDEILEALFPLR
ncbi:MAG: PQQ-binding-like beta-propeller repeat protein [Acidobacteriota bacterium]